MRFNNLKQIESPLAPETVWTRIVEAGEPEPQWAILRLRWIRLPMGKNYFVRHTTTGIFVYGQGSDARSWVTVRIESQKDGSRILLSSTSVLVWIVLEIASLAIFGIVGLSLLVASLYSILTRDGFIFWSLMLLGSAIIGVGALAGHRHDCRFVDRMGNLFEGLLAGNS
jgi:hypothetical protein